MKFFAFFTLLAIICQFTLAVPTTSRPNSFREIDPSDDNLPLPVSDAAQQQIQQSYGPKEMLPSAPMNAREVALVRSLSGQDDDDIHIPLLDEILFGTFLVIERKIQFALEKLDLEEGKRLRVYRKAAMAYRKAKFSFEYSQGVLKFLGPLMSEKGKKRWEEKVAAKKAALTPLEDQKTAAKVKLEEVEKDISKRVEQLEKVQAKISEIEKLLNPYVSDDQESA